MLPSPSLELQSRNYFISLVKFLEESSTLLRYLVINLATFRITEEGSERGP